MSAAALDAAATSTSDLVAATGLVDQGTSLIRNVADFNKAPGLRVRSA